jgi:serine/threonine-protein kinase
MLSYLFGHLDDAVESATQAYRIIQSHGADVPLAVRNYVDEGYARVLDATGRSAEAEPLFRDLLARVSEMPDANRFQVNGAVYQLAKARFNIGRFEDAATGLRSLVGRDDKDPVPYNQAMSINLLGLAELALGRAEAALAEFRSARSLVCSSDRPASSLCLRIRLNEANAFVLLDRQAAARQALAELDRTLGNDSTVERKLWRVLEANARLARGDAEGAAAVIAPRLAQARQAGEYPAITDATALSEGARIEERLGDKAAALADLREAERRMALVWQGVPPQLAEVRARLATLER